MLTKEAFNALLKTLEEPPEHVKFIFATTEANKIPITILSRCQRFDFAGIDMSSIQTRLTQIAAAEGVEIEPEATQILASRAAGSMRDSQSLLEQLLSVTDKRITGAEVHALMGTAPVERLSGLVRSMASRDAAAALAELDAAVAGGVEIGQLLDQLVGYFRDVMAVAVGCPPQQMLYAIPSQAEEVAAIGQQLGLSTVLAMVQILDQTAARLRVSLHGRTLVEMAIVRISQLEDLDDLASLVAELRGEPGSASPRTEKKNIVLPPRPTAPAKKNIEPPPPATSIGAIPALPEPAAPVVQVETAPPVAASEPEIEPPAPPSNGESHAAADSVLKQFQLAVEAAKSGNADSTAAAPRVSRRQQAAEQLKEVSQRPFVERALELFEIETGQFRYTPPEEEN